MYYNVSKYEIIEVSRRAPAARRIKRARGPRGRPGARTVRSNSGEIEVIMDNPALGLDSVIFESFSCISLDSIMDSIDSSQIPLLIGRGRRRWVEGAKLYQCCTSSTVSQLP